MNQTSVAARNQILATVQEFVQREVVPRASKHDRDDTYPHELVEQMKELGLFGITVPEEYGGLGLDYTTFAMVFEELAKGWMSITGVIGTHSILTYVVARFGSEEQKREWLPSLAQGERRGALAMTEANAGSDVAALETTAVRDGDEYVVNGAKLFITNGRYSDVVLLMAKTNPDAQPPHSGISALIVEKGPGFTVGPDMEKLGYRGIDTCELIFQDCRVPAKNLVGYEEGRGFRQVMEGLETGRINIAARGVGVATAAFEHAIRYAQQRKTFGQPIANHQAVQLMLADMATKIRAARLLVYDAAAKKDRGERCDQEAGMAKLYASEMCAEVTLDAMRIHGGYGYIKDLPLERYYRDAPLMIIGEGTNEIQKIVIARSLLRQYAI
ncbi:MAG: acyl-CoA dehydrogenase family protein [Chloroflexi bacterium]|nr:acyl-CoA dehydrogenase family protein [Chloroflexota bacterium]